MNVADRSCSLTLPLVRSSLGAVGRHAAAESGSCLDGRHDAWRLRRVATSRATVCMAIWATAPTRRLVPHYADLRDGPRSSWRAVARPHRSRASTHRTPSSTGSGAASTTVRFEPVASTCLGSGDAGEFDVITPGKVLAEMKKLDWPEAELTIQPPDGKTLVNLHDQLLLRPPKHHAPKTITLLGQQVAITATPVELHLALRRREQADDQRTRSGVHPRSRSRSATPTSRPTSPCIPGST